MLKILLCLSLLLTAIANGDRGLSSFTDTKDTTVIVSIDQDSDNKYDEADNLDACLTRYVIASFWGPGQEITSQAFSSRVFHCTSHHRIRAPPG